MIAQARVVGWRARLSLFSSTTTFAPKMAYSSSRRTQLVQLGRRPRPRRDRLRVEGDKHWVQRRGDGLAGALAGGSDGPLADGFGVAAGHAQAVATEGFAQ
jgi:hypothetical protein